MDKLDISWPNIAAVAVHPASDNKNRIKPDGMARTTCSYDCVEHLAIASMFALKALHRQNPGDLTLMMQEQDRIKDAEVALSKLDDQFRPKIF